MSAVKTPGARSAVKAMAAGSAAEAGTGWQEANQRYLVAALAGVRRARTARRQ